MHATGSAGNQGQKSDAAVSVVETVLADLLLCGVLQNPVDLVGEAELAIKLGLEGGAMAVVGNAEVSDKGEGARGVREVGEKFDVAPAFSLAGRNARILGAMSGPNASILGAMSRAEKKLSCGRDEEFVYNSGKSESLVQEE